MDKPTRWLGLDVSAATFDAAVAEPGDHADLRHVQVRRFPRTKEGASACLDWAREVTGIAMESTGWYSQDLWKGFHLGAPDLPIAVLNPAQVKAFGKSLGLRTKTDALDARLVACFAAERQPRGWAPLGAELQALRMLVQERQALVRALTALRHRTGSTEEVLLVTQVQAHLQAELEQAIASLEAGLRAQVKDHEELRRDVQLLESLPGVGFLTAVVVLATLGDLRRFTRGRQLAAFAGVSPQQRESGTSVRGRTRLCKQGNPEARTALYMAALSLTRSNSPLRRVYLDLVARGKARRAAIGALMRRLLLLMRAVLIQGCPFEPTRMLG